MSELESLPPGRSRETKITRDAEGRWWNDGVPITHPNLVRAFDRWLEPVADTGRFCLHNAINWAFVTIEGAPRFVRRVALEGDRLELTLSNESVEPLEPSTLRQGRDGALYCDLADGLVARFDRAAMMQLADWLGEDEQGVYLEIGDRRVHPPILDDVLAATRSHL